MGIFERFGPNIEKLKENNDVDGLIRALDSPDGAIRSAAARDLGTLGSSAVTGILDAMELMDPQGRERSACALMEPGLPALPFLLSLVVHASAAAREPLAGAVARQGKPAFDYLLTGIDSKNPRVRRGVAIVLGSMGRRAVEPLERLLGDPDRTVKKEAATSLHTLGYEASDPDSRAYLLLLREEWEELARMKKHAVPVLLRCLAGADPQTKRSIIKTLGKVRDHRSLSALLAAANDPDSDIRIAAIEAIGESGERGAIPTLQQALHDAYPQVRMEAAWSLGRIGWVPASDSERVAYSMAREEWHEVLKVGKGAIPALVASLGEEHSGVRAGAIETLRKLGEPAHRALVSAAKGSDPRRAKAARQALRVIAERNQEESRKIQRKEDAGRFSKEMEENLEARRRHQQSCGRESPSLPVHGEREVPPGRAAPEPGRVAAQPTPRMLSENERAVMAGFNAAPAEKSAPKPAFRHETQEKSAESKEELRRMISENEQAVLKGLRRIEAEKRAAERLQGAGRPPADTESGRVTDLRGIPPERLAALSSGNRPSPVLRDASDDEGRIETGDDPLDRLLRALQDPDEEIRAAAIESLRLMGEPAVDALLQALADPDHFIRIAAAEALGFIGGRKALGALLSLLSDTDEDVRVAAVRALGMLHDPRAMPFLLGLFADNYYAVRFAAADAIVLFKDQSLGLLVDALEDERGIVRITAARALGKLADLRTIPALIEHLGDEVPEVRYTVSQALAEIGLPSVKPLTWVLKKGTREERLAALDALGQILDDSARKAIEVAESDPDPEVREKASKMLRKHEVLDVWRKAWMERLGQEEEVSATANAIEEIDEEIFESRGAVEIDNLITALRDQKGTSQMAAAMRLIMMGRPAVEGLIRAMKDEDSGIQMAAAEVLSEMRGVAVEPLMDALHDEDLFIRIVAARNLGKIGSDQATDALIEAIEDDPDARVRAVVAEALGYLGDARTIAVLAAALRDRDEEVQMAAAHSLGYIGGRDAIEPLIGALGDVDERVNRVALDALRDPEGNVHDHLLDALTEGEKKYRRGVADALDMLGWEPATPEHHAYYLMAKDRWAELEGVGAAAIGPLEEALRDPDPGIRLEALKAVGRIGGERAIRPLIHALSDPDAMLRSRAERALIDTGAPAAAPLEAAMEGADDRTRTLIGRILGRIAPENSEERQD